MSIHFVSGKPGGGKGLYSIKAVVDELRFGKRGICTNLAVKLQPWVGLGGRGMVGLQAYLQAKFGSDFDCLRRVHVLPEDDAGDFYLWRLGPDGWVKVQAQREGQKIVGFDTAKHCSDAGVLYVIDEAWKFYGARDWQNTGKGVLFYAAQHRKFGDDVFLVSQSSKQIDTALRQVSQDFTVVRNHGKERIGVFRQPGVFSVCIYTEPPVGPSVQPMQRTVFRLDGEGLGACFDTSAGVGVAGGAAAAADSQERKKGLSVLWLIPVALVGLYLVASWPKLIGYLAGKASKIGTGAAVVASGGSLTNQVVTRPAGPDVSHSNPVQGGPAASAGPDRGRPGPVSGGLEPAGGLVSATKGGDALPEEKSVSITGFALVGGRAHVMLSDGRTYTEDDRELEFVARRFCIIGGRVYRWGRGAAAPAGPGGVVAMGEFLRPSPGASSVVVPAPSNLARSTQAGRLAQ